MDSFQTILTLSCPIGWLCLCICAALPAGNRDHLRCTRSLVSQFKVFPLLLLSAMLLTVATLEKDKSYEEEQDDQNEGHGDFIEDARLFLDLLVEQLQFKRLA